MLRDFIEEAPSSDQVFQKNIDLLNTAENIISHIQQNEQETGIFVQLH